MSSRSRKVRIVTASWFTKLPDDVARIGISRGLPRGQSGYRRLPSLAPGRWYRSVGEEEYIQRYREQLAALDPHEVYERIVGYAAGAQTAALVCFERPGTTDGWCHRAISARWLSDGLGVAVPEFGCEELVQAEHPMLPPSLRAKLTAEWVDRARAPAS